MGLTCQIFIRRPREGVHMAGKPVIGTVRYAVGHSTEYKDIVLSLVGKGECHWTENRRTHSRRRHGHGSTRLKHYKGSEVFVENNISILNKEPGLLATLPAGTYECNFKFLLPENIPPSYEDSVCRIAYQIRLKFEKPSLLSFNKKFSTTLNVYGCVKSAAPEGKTLFGLEKTLIKPFSKRTHQINLKADISNIIYSPGENADISFTVTNISDVKITAIKTELLCYTTYTANCGRKKETVKTIKESTVETPSVPAEAVANMNSVLPIQAHLYSIQNSQIIKKEYKVKVTLRLPMPYINASVELPIVVGDKCDDRQTQRAMFARSAPGPSVEAVEGSSNGPPSYWQVMCEDFDESGYKEND